MRKSLINLRKRKSNNSNWKLSCIKAKLKITLIISCEPTFTHKTMEASKKFLVLCLLWTFSSAFVINKQVNKEFEYTIVRFSHLDFFFKISIDEPQYRQVVKTTQETLTTPKPKYDFNPFLKLNFDFTNVDDFDAIKIPLRSLF